MPSSGGKIFLENWRWAWTILDFRWQMVLRGIFRNKARSCIGVIAAAMGAALVLTALGMVDSLRDMIIFQFDKVLVSDYTLTLKDDVDPGALFEARRLPGVTKVEPIFQVPCTFYHKNHSKKGSITGIVEDSKLTIPRNESGKPVSVPAVGLLMTKRLAEALHIQKGDTVKFVPVKGEKRVYEVPVVKNSIEHFWS